VISYVVASNRTKLSACLEYKLEREGSIAKIGYSIQASIGYSQHMHIVLPANFTSWIGRM
jgi:hypothetical protein